MPQTAPVPKGGQKSASRTPAFARVIPHNSLNYSDPFHWMHLAIRDFIAAPMVSLFYGFCFTVASVAIWAAVFIQGTHLVILPSLVVFMLAGPFLATGLYDVSWQLERGKRPNLFHSIRAIRRNGVSEWGFAVLLAVMMIFWMRVAAMIHALYPINQDAHIEQFLPFLSLGTLFGLLFTVSVFSFSAFSIPVMMERRVDIMTAISTSVSAVYHNAGVMVVWALIISACVVVGFATAGVGMLVIMPMLGYATWHGYIRTIKTKRPRRFE
ncbi:DUF2189 domain-containing protein [Ferrimonas sediminicola]|uniref:DUF2189 domain-containing protein n=1 Tax=Ferrimonas sediminicola TaxID=2569538 RepID=A0A4U1BD18_9GAMM|nr:DUF2189 domain-containing protein [Ferrimonas sediminicola]TKB48135.1 DUF2189 domain-containing protein [Ferrimonas sediminicola]